MNTKTMILMGALSSTMLLGSACVPQLDGEEGNLVLSYDKGPLAGATGSSPLAKGAKLKYSVTEKNGDKQKLPIDAAQSSADKVIAVAGLEGGAMILEALDKGQASVDVDAGGLHDVFELNAVEVDALSFAHACEPGGEAAYFVDSDIRLHYTMKSAGKIAVGYGYYPVEFEPQDGAALAEYNLSGLLPIRTGATPGEVKIASTISEDSFAIKLVEPKDVSGLRLHEDELFTDGRVPVGVDKVASLHVFPLVGEVPVCQNNVELNVAVSTPDICSVSFTQGPDETEAIFRLYETQILEVKGLAEGDCSFRVTMPAAADGAGVSFEQTVQIIPPSEGDSSSDDDDFFDD